MKKFLASLLLAASVWLALMILPLAIRTALWQRRAAELYSVPDGVEVLCIGNSHTGCTWSEDAEFGFMKAWRSGRAFPFAAMRLMEFDRLGQLDGVKVCIMDCDRTTFAAMTEKKIRQGYSESFAQFFRYLGLSPLPAVELLADAAMKWFKEWPLPDGAGGRPADDRRWTERTAAERAGNIAREYSPEVWNSVRPVAGADANVLMMARRAQEICDRHGIRLVLFAAPVTSDNPERTCPEVYSRELDALVGRLRAAGVEYLDLRAACPDEWFRDCHHLSAEGSRAFTRKFIEETLDKQTRDAEK